jgi:hypothetical protein
MKTAKYIEVRTTESKVIGEQVRRIAVYPIAQIADAQDALEKYNREHPGEPQAELVSIS